MLVLAACTPTPRPRPTASTPLPTPTTGFAVPRPAGMLRSGWTADPFARGASSFVAVGSAPEHRQTLRAALDDRIFFAGEATSDDQPGTVAGALDSGSRAATEVETLTRGSERIAVIGAGAAGAAAARRLFDAGHAVTVLEARDRVGGRISTVRDDEWPAPIELGAAWVRGGDVESLSARLARLGVATAASPTEDGVLRVTPDGALVDGSGDAAAAVDEALGWARDRAADVSIADALTGSGAGEVSDAGAPSPAARLAAALRLDLGLPVGAPAEEASAWYTDPGPAVFAGELVLGGYDAVVADLLDGIDVWLGSPVTGLSYNDSGVSVRLSTGEALSVDRVVVTVPLGVLKDEGLQFDPPLPFAKRGAIAELGVGDLETVALRFDEPFWDTDAIAWSIVGDADFPEWVNLEPLTGEPVLLGLVGAAAARDFADLDDAGVLERALTSLAAFASGDRSGAGTTASSGADAPAAGG
ncbi:MAG: oxidoreductase [Naasia sp.]|nr:oxidoreductase [Naasia sp.]